MLFDDLLKFYWPSLKARRSGKKPETRRGIRRFLALFVSSQRRHRVVKGVTVAVALLVVAFGSASAFGASVRLSDQRNVIFDRLGTEQGLSQGAVMSITQDEHGFIWIGTQEGLNRYDGHEFETFYRLEDDPDSLSHDWVWDVLEDSRGNLWVATDDGLNRFDEVTRSFESYDHDRGTENEQFENEHNSIHTLFEDSKSNLWLGTGAGLTKMIGDSQFEHFHHDPDDPGSIGKGSVRAIYEDSNGALWVGTEEGGLSRFNSDTKQFTRYVHKRTGNSLSDDYIRTIVEDSRGHLWIGTFNGGISVFNPATEAFRHYRYKKADEHGLGSDRVRTLLKDDNGDIWIGTDGGLNLWREETETFLRYRFDPTDINSISDNTVFELFQDDGGVIWVGTFNGISKWNARIETFPHFKRDANLDQGGLTSNSITSFAEGTEGDIWIGTFDGINKWDSERNRFQSYTADSIDFSDDRVMSLLVHEGQLWAGTMAGGVHIIENGELVDIYANDPQDSYSIKSNAISKIYRDSNGQIWLTTFGGGVERYLGDGRFEHFPKEENPAGEFTALTAGDLVEAPDGNFWIATNGGGIVVLDPDNGNTFSFTHDPADPKSLSSDNVISLLRTEEAIWVGTLDRGINRYDPKTGEFDRYTKADGLASDAVYGILEDGQGRMWISGGKGLSVLDVDTGRFTTYDSTHGLQSDDFNSGAYLKLSDGSFLFGGNNGFNVFEPEKIKGNNYVPPIRLTKVTKFNKPVELEKPVYEIDSLEVEYGDSVIGFEFAAMDFTAPEKNRYQYKLEGFDRDWVSAGKSRQVTYTNLDPGEYQFRVRGSNNDRVWNEEGVSLDLAVLPPIWATWWAYCAYAAITFIVLYQLYRANERRLRHEAERRYSERLQLYIESLEEATDCVLIADANKKLMYANNAVRNIVGLTPAGVVGKPLMSILFSRPEDAEAALEGLSRDGRWHGEVRNQRDNEFCTVENTIAAVRNSDDRETAYVSISRDVTDRKKTEAELENHRRNLEFLVAERTKALEREIRENKEVQRELANSLREKELLLKEVHHRVKNNMQVISSLLNIQAESVGDEVFASLLGESQQRIKSMSLIHENLYQSENLLEIDFEDYIKMLANSLCRFHSIPGVSINLDIDVVDVSLDLETAVPCGLIINELVSNALKHAYKGCGRTHGTISISFRHDGCRYVLEVKDDGEGLPEEFTLAGTSSMGMEIVSILTQQLDGRLCFNNQGGAAFQISFPRKERHA